jgi:predicted nucleic acid-binding protein
MATEVVVDSSMIVALVTPEKYSEWASKKIQEHEYFHVLDLSFYEVANALEHKVSGDIDAKDAAAAFEQAEKMMKLYEVHNFSEIIIDALNKALELNTTVYDAAFLSLASKLNLQLITLDAKLAKKLECTKYKGLIEYPNKTPIA